MLNNIKISLPDIYEPPTESMVSKAKQYVADRVKASALLMALIDALLESASAKVTAICYKYNVDPLRFQISEDYNPRMMEEINEVMDALENDILDLIEQYSSECAKDDEHRQSLLVWLLALGRGGNDLQTTLNGYLYKTLKDWEAAIAALKWAKVSQTRAASIIKSNLHTIYMIPQVRAAMKYGVRFAATYIRYGGVRPGAVGLSNNGSTNVTNMANITLQMAWQREQLAEFQEEGASGYYQLRGSTYPCSPCDDEVGLHVGIDIYAEPMVHPHCQCFRIPVHTKADIDYIESNQLI